MAGSRGATDGGGGFSTVSPRETHQIPGDSGMMTSGSLSGNRLYEIYDFMDAGPDEWENGQGK